MVYKSFELAVKLSSVAVKSAMSPFCSVVNVEIWSSREENFEYTATVIHTSGPFTYDLPPLTKTPVFSEENKKSKTKMCLFYSLDQYQQSQ